MNYVTYDAIINLLT